MRPSGLHDVLNDVIEIMIQCDLHTICSPLEQTLYQLPPHLKLPHHTHDHLHLLQLEKYATQQTLAKINMERKNTNIYANIKLLSTGDKKHFE